MHVYTHLNRKEMCNSSLLEGLNEARRQTQVSKSEFVFLGGSRGLNFSFVVLICVSDIQRVFFMEEERGGVRERSRRKGRRGLLKRRFPCLEQLKFGGNLLAKVFQFW